jgi:hypothetical protein
LGEKWAVNLACDSDFHVNRRVLLHAANLRHGTDGFTFPPKGGMLRIFSPEKFSALAAARLNGLATQIIICVVIIISDSSCGAGSIPRKNKQEFK